MPNQFLSPEGDLENYFLTEYWLIDQYVGDELWNWGYAGPNLFIYNVDSFPSVPGSSYGATFNGDNTSITKSIPVTTFAGGNNWKQIDFGSAAASIKTDGTLWVWGTNDYGVLGTFDTAYKTTPVTTFAGGTNWKQVSSGGSVIAAIKTDGTLWTWGRGVFGKLGTNDTVDRSTPVTTFAGGTNWKQVSVGNQHTAAIKTDGTLWTWGIQTTFQSLPPGVLYGSLGTNDDTNRSTPVTTFAGGTNWKQVSCGDLYTAAIKTDGTLWTWGDNSSGQLGTNDATRRSTPVTTFSGGTNWKQVSCGGSHTAAIKTDGTLWVWGQGSSGRLGNNDAPSNRFTPVTTFAGGTNWKQVSCGIRCTAAIKTDGTLWTWGYNLNGQLGINDIITRSTPVTTFAGGTNWKQVTTSEFNTGAVLAGTTPDLPIS